MKSQSRGGTVEGEDERNKGFPGFGVFRRIHLWAFSALICFVVQALLIYWKTDGLTRAPGTRTILVSLFVLCFYLVGGFFVIYAELNRRAAAARSHLVDYVQQLRAYTVESVEPLRKAVTMLADEAWSQPKQGAVGTERDLDTLRQSVADLHRAVEQIQGAQLDAPPVAVPSAFGDRQISTLERNTLLKIIYAMATDRPYNYDPSARRSDAPATIAGATVRANFLVSDDTIRKYLKQAAELVR